MPDNVSLAVAGSALTYFAQMAAAYLLVRLICPVIPSARARMWLWSGFLLGALAGWLAFLTLPLRVSAAPSVQLLVNQPAGALRWSYRLNEISSTDLNLWESWGLRFYHSVVLVCLLVWGYKRFRLWTFLRLGQSPSCEVSLLFRRLAKKMKVKSCRIIVLPQLRSPSMAGWFRPYVLLPGDLLPGLKRSELIEILLHELIHVRRRDYLWDQVAALACRVVFFHPVVWLAHRHLRRERELALDRTMGGQQPTRRLRYAECLMRLAKWWFLADRYSAEAIGVSPPASFLATRVRILLEEPKRRSSWQILGRAGVVTLIALGGTYGVLSAGVTFYQADGKHLNPRAQLHTSSGHARRMRPLNAEVQRSVQPMPTSQVERNNSEWPYRDHFEETLSFPGRSRRAVESLTPRAELEASWSSAANDHSLQDESKPLWNEGSIEKNPLSRPGWAAAADAAMRVAIGIALAAGDDDFRDRH